MIKRPLIVLALVSVYGMVPGFLFGVAQSQTAVPNPEHMSRAINIIAVQRNNALDAAAINEARVGMLEAENKKLRDELDALKKPKEPAKE